MESKHTKGPWEMEYDNYGNDSYSEWIDIFTSHNTIAQVGRSRKMTEENKANARLIAAAPELLEALKKLVPITWNDGPLAKAYEDIGKKAEEAIAAATKEVER